MQLMKQIEAVIFDWAGTTVDYGCMAPIQAMQQAFQEYNVEASLSDIRRPMGMLKKDHIRAVLEGERVRNIFRQVHGREYSSTDVDNIYNSFEKQILAILDNHARLIEGVLPVQDFLRHENIKIGSTTGYTRQMIDIVAAGARRQGYQPDHIVAADEVPRGRPYPYMLHLNLAALDVKDVRQVMKVGDTIVDIQEGLYAGCCTVGVVKGSSMVGLSEEEASNMRVNEFQLKIARVKAEMLSAGAHYVIESIADLPKLIETISKRERHVA